MKPPLILIGGPTASGKTALALALARAEKGVIINADAMQVYAGLPLLTAQPSAAEKAEIPHLLFEIFEPQERSSAGIWLALAEAALKSATESGKTPIVVGGTGLYFRALEGGLADIPPIPNGVRDEAQTLYKALGEAGFRERLRERDPESATKIKPNDRQRLIRAYEVVAHTSSPLGFFHEKAATDSVLKKFDVRRFLLLPERSMLYAACDARFLQMMEQGAEREVEALLQKNLDPALPTMKILGVPEIAAFLKNTYPRAEAIAKAQQATRHYAKRQVTWFKNQWRSADDLPLTIIEP